MTGKYYDIATCAQALTLKVIKCPDKENTQMTGVSRTAINRIYKTALQRGYNPEICQTILNSYIEDAPKLGALVKATPAVKDAIVAIISKNLSTRELSCQAIADSLSDVEISACIVHRVLKRYGYRLYKPTIKPGLIAENKIKRLEWCKEYKDWTLEDWKNVIWSDETSVTLGGQCRRRRV